MQELRTQQVRVSVRPLVASDYIRRMRQVLLAISLLGVLLATAQAPPIHTHRPRMLADTARIAWMQANRTLPGEFGDTYDLFEYRYNNWWINDPQLYLLGSDSTMWTWNWSSPYATDEAEYTVVLWRLNGDPAQLKRCRFLAEQVIGKIQTTDFSVLAFFDAEAIHRQMSAAGMLLLDWCYDDLPVPLRQELAQQLYVSARSFMATHILSASGNSYVSSHNTWNCVYANQNALVLHAADGLTPQQQDTVLQWHEAVYNKWVNGFFPVYQHYRDDDGGWNWGAAYAMWSLIDQFQLFDNMLIATGTNWYTGLPWVLNSINQYLYFIQPNDLTLHFGDGMARLYGDHVVYRHASIFQDPRSMWMAQEYSQALYLGNTNPVFLKMVYKDFTLPAVPFPDPPLDWWSDKVGLSVSRSDWSDSATMVSFQCAPSKRAAHEHRDNNSFAIYRNAPLLLDAGHYDSYGSPHMRDYYNRTIAHNTILVYDSTEQMTSFGTPAANDGGQIDSPALQNYNEIFLPQNQRGEWVRYGTGNGYQLSIADAQLSYLPAKLDRFRRRLLYLKPDRIVVLDHLHIPGVGVQQRDVQWIAHFAGEPSMSGALTEAEVPGHIETYDGNDHMSANGEGSIALRTLLPTNSRTTRVGGDGYRYWVANADHPPSTSIDTTIYTPGNWRLEVRPEVMADSLVFLHTIRTGTDVQPAQPGGVALISSSSIAVDWNDTLLLFSASGEVDVMQHLMNDLQGPAQFHVLAGDLMEGAYCLFIDGTQVASGQTDGNGFLQVPLLLGNGTHTLEVVECSTGMPTITAEADDIAAYPNPTEGELRLWNPGQPLSAEVFDALGRPILATDLRTGSNKIDLSGLPAGCYMIRTDDGSAVRVMKR